MLSNTIILSNPGWHAERYVSVGNLSAAWRVNGPGRLSCHLSGRDAHLLGFPALLGRWVWWQGPTGPWAGYVEDLSSDVSTGVIELSCTDMSSLLDLMMTPRTYRLTSSSAGALIGRTIRDSGVDTGTWFTRLIIDEDGPPVTVEARGEQTGNVVRSLANSAGGQWYVEIEADKSLTFVYQSLPLDKRGSILLVEGHNVLDGSVRPSIANLVNDLLGVANDRDWQRAGAARVTNLKSVRLYDRRRAAKRYPGHTHKASIESRARADLATLSVPSGPVSLEVSAKTPIATELRIGQLVRLWSKSQNRVYDLTILGLAHDTNRASISVVGTVVEAESSWPRFVDPKRHIERATEEAHGLLTARELSHQIDTANRVDAEFGRTQRYISPETIELHCPNPAANTTTLMTHLIASGTTTTALIAINLGVPQQCRMTHLRLMASSYVTAGTITPVLTIYEPDLGASTDYQIDECQISTVLDEWGNQRSSRSVFFDWDIALQLAKDEHWIVSVVTDAAYLPLTNDYKAIITLSVDQWT